MTEMAPDARLPDFLIIGAMKAGTSSLAAYIRAHPEAFCWGETHFFSYRFDQGLEWYRNHFVGGETAKVVGEKCPIYMYSRGALQRMQSVLPEAKLISVLRNPVDRAYSHYWHERRRGNETRSFVEAIASEDRKGAGVDASHAYLGRGRYREQLEAVCELYPRDRLLVLLFEDLRDEPHATFSEVCAFLGISEVLPEILGARVNPYRQHRPRWLWDLMSRRRLWRFLPKRMARSVAQWITQEAQYEPMDPVVRAELTERFAVENERLAEWLGRDLAKWSV